MKPNLSMVVRWLFLHVNNTEVNRHYHCWCLDAFFVGEIIGPKEKNHTIIYYSIILFVMEKRLRWKRQRFRNEKKWVLSSMSKDKKKELIIMRLVKYIIFCLYLSIHNIRDKILLRALSRLCIISRNSFIIHYWKQPY